MVQIGSFGYDGYDIGQRVQSPAVDVSVRGGSVEDLRRPATRVPPLQNGDATDAQLARRPREVELDRRVTEDQQPTQAAGRPVGGGDPLSGPVTGGRASLARSLPVVAPLSAQSQAFERATQAYRDTYDRQFLPRPTLGVEV